MTPMMEWLAKLYVDTLNMIHYMHDKYYYEAAEMALIDTNVRRTFATGIAGFSHVVDSLSAIKYAKVKVIRDETGIASGLRDRGRLPDDTETMMTVRMRLRYGCLRTFMDKLKKCHTYQRFRANDFYPDHYIQRGLRKGNRFPAGWKKSGRTAGTGSKPVLRRREERSSGFLKLCRKTALRAGTWTESPIHRPSIRDALGT